ncbi:MAG: hypothetical protein SOX25_02915, partial [Eubacteriales bacterium]|nr:hypothetical protein [Eubacteriales bacterium]
AALRHGAAQNLDQQSIALRRFVLGQLAVSQAQLMGTQLDRPKIGMTGGKKLAVKNALFFLADFPRVCVLDGFVLYGPAAFSPGACLLIIE